MSLFGKGRSAESLAARIEKTHAKHAARVAKAKADLDAERESHAAELAERRSHVDNRLAELESEKSALQSLDSKLSA